jgi:hypothetical protein
LKLKLHIMPTCQQYATNTCNFKSCPMYEQFSTMVYYKLMNVYH